MLDRLQFLVVYVGSAAMAAFLAACLSSSHVATFRCQTEGADGSQRCERSGTLTSAAPDTSVTNVEYLEYISPGDMSLESVALATAR